MKRLAVLAVLALASCDDAGPIDLGASVDLRGPDLPITLPDLSACEAPTFAGFSGASASERRLDCGLCGCVVDTLTHAASNDLWARSASSASLHDDPAGLRLVVDGGADVAFATIASSNPIGDFYLDGDFDLRVDYALSMLPPGGALALRATLRDDTAFDVRRARSSDGDERYATALLDAVVHHATTAPTGTLRLVRVGDRITAYGDGVLLATADRGAAGRASISLTGIVEGCVRPDAGSADAGTCALQVTAHQLRLASGALVDRR